MNKLYVSILCILAVAFFCGCSTNQRAGHIVLAEGSLSVNNKSDVDIFPIVQTGQKEDFGGISAADFKLIGFARIDADKIARVTWAEKNWDAFRRSVIFPLKITEHVAGQTKHIEFLYKGSGEWILNLYSSSPPRKNNLLVAVNGQLQSGGN